MKTRCILLILGCLLAAFACSACTQYERDGYNPKPFNAPAGWETNPYGDQAFRN